MCVFLPKNKVIFGYFDNLSCKNAREPLCFYKPFEECIFFESTGPFQSKHLPNRTMD
jgi:hypothetical protein